MAEKEKNKELENLLHEISVIDKAEALFHVSELYKKKEHQKRSKSNDVRTIGKIKMKNTPDVYMLQVKHIERSKENSDSESS